MRILLGLNEVAGYYSNLALGFRELGVDCRVLDLSANPFQYSGGGCSLEGPVVRMARRSSSRVTSLSRRSPLRKAWWIAVNLFCRLLLLAYSAAHFDAFIFGYASTFLGYHELPLLRALGKTIIYVFNGSDHRPPYINGVFALKNDADVRGCIAHARDIKRRLQRIERNAHWLVGHHLSAHFHERPFVPGLVLGIPCPLVIAGHAREPGDESGAVRIVHAPSRPEVKGTGAIRAAVERLREKGYAIEYVELVGSPNSVVLDELGKCDLVVDELYSDTRMAGLAAEAACLGKPVLVGGYATDEDICTGLPADVMSAPVHHVRPEDVERGLELLVRDGQYRESLGRRASEFVTTHWAAGRVAERYLRLVRGEVTESWLFNPSLIRYLHGFGMPEERAQSGVRAVICAGGVEALQLADKPQLESAFVKFADVANA